MSLPPNPVMRLLAAFFSLIALASPSLADVGKHDLDGDNCLLGWAPRGVDEWGNAQSCQDISTYAAGHTNGANCAAGQYPLGVDADGAVESCTDDSAHVHDNVTDLAGSMCGTNEIIEDQGAAWACIATPVDTNANTICTGTNVYLDGEGNCDTLSATDTSAATECATNELYDGDGDCIPATWGEFDTTHSPVGVWNFTDGSLADGSGNGNTLKWVTGDDATINWTNEDGDDGVVCGQSSIPTGTFNDHGFLNGDVGAGFTEADFRITGALTVQAVVNVDSATAGGTNQAIVSQSGAAGDAVAADNWLYSLGIKNTAAANSFFNLRYFAESSGGTNEAVNESNVYPPDNTRTHVAFVRDADGDITFYINGSDFGIAQHALLSPTGGASTEFIICENLESNQAFTGTVFAVKVVAAELTQAQIQAEVTRTMGIPF